MTHREDLFNYIETHHKRNLKGITEARAVDPDRFDDISERFLTWGIEALGDGFMKRSADAFVDFSNDVILEQGRYEIRGTYTNSSFEECNKTVYGSREVMDHYLWGVYITNFLWAHHMELSLFYADRFLDRLPGAPKIVEIAPGHGGWGVWALHNRPDASLLGFDISPSSIHIASSIAKAAGVADRAEYALQNALDLDSLEAESADAVICSFLIEHLEDPDKLVQVIGHLLKPHGYAYLSGALTAAQIDHIYEFTRESEFLVMAEKHGMRVLETMSASPRRVLPRAKQLPRSMGLVLQKRVHDHW